VSPQPKAKSKTLEIILPVKVPKKNSTRYEETENEGQALANLYLKTPGVQQLGNPQGIKVTIEAYDGE
jgi:hypothetical protein